MYVLVGDNLVDKLDGQRRGHSWCRVVGLNTLNEFFVLGDGVLLGADVDLDGFGRAFGRNVHFAENAGRDTLPPIRLMKSPNRS